MGGARGRMKGWRVWPEAGWVTWAGVGEVWGAWRGVEGGFLWKSKKVPEREKRKRGREKRSRWGCVWVREKKGRERPLSC
ncbi:MAG: hypothetical protein ACKERG_04180 [Candidatus Hodgkinia cicadicola]